VRIAEVKNLIFGGFLKSTVRQLSALTRTIGNSKI